MRRGWWLVLLVLLAGCGSGGRTESTPDPFDEPNDAPVTPPPGWRTVSNTAAGFSVAAPDTWTAGRRGGASVIRSDDRLVAIDVAADRSRAGRDTAAGRYARATLHRLPGFDGRIPPGTTPVRGSPYETGVASATGRISGSRTPERITVAVFHRPGRVTYAAVVFRNASVRRPYDELVVQQLLRSFRARPPYTS